MTDQFLDPTQPGMFRPGEWDRHLLLIEAQRFLENVPTSNGPADAVEARVHVLSAPGGTEVIEQARLFGAFASSTRDAIGSAMPVVGRVLQFTSRAGGPAYRLDSASPEDKQAAAGYWNQWQAQQVQQVQQPTVQPQQGYEYGPQPVSNPAPQFLPQPQRPAASPAPAPAPVPPYQPSPTAQPPAQAQQVYPPAGPGHPVYDAYQAAQPQPQHAPAPVVHGTPVQPQHQLPGPVQSAPAAPVQAPVQGFTAEQLAYMPKEAREMLMGQQGGQQS